VIVVAEEEVARAMTGRGVGVDPIASLPWNGDDRAAVKCFYSKVP
jgi:hypothetical protein